jgi:hypothetical protein
MDWVRLKERVGEVVIEFNLNDIILFGVQLGEVNWIVNKGEFNAGKVQ